jgi:streptogramin lyase
VVAKIPIGKKPIGVAVGEGSVWVLDDDGSVWRIDPVTNKATVINAVADDPRAISAGEGAVWVADTIGRAIHKIDPASNRVVGSFPAASGALEVAAGQGAVWVLGRGGIVRYDPVSGQSEQLGGPIQFDSLGYLAIGSSDVWYADDFGHVIKIDPKTNKFSHYQLEKAAAALAADTDSAWVAACGTPATVFRIDDQSGDIAATIAAGGAVCAYAGVTGNRMSIAVGSDGAWVIDAPNGTVSRIRFVTNQVDTPIHVGDTPTAVAVGLGSVWVTVDGR